MKFLVRRVALAFLFVFLVVAITPAEAQRKNTYYVDQFTGSTVGAKLAKAQQACMPDSIPCFLILDPTLKAWPEGTLPAKCANCYWEDYRNGLPTFPAVATQTRLDLQKDYGAKGDAGFYITVNCTSGSANLTGYFANLTGAQNVPKQGQKISVLNCGAAGAALTCTLASFSGSATNGQSGTAVCGGGVTAGATTSGAAIWGTALDDTPAFASAFNDCKTKYVKGGCLLDVPAGGYLVNAATLPAVVGANAGRVTVNGAGFDAAFIIQTTANHSPTFTIPENSMPVTIQGLGFYPFNYNSQKPTTFQIAGGSDHVLTRNAAYQGYEFVRAGNSWDNEITFNKCYGSFYNCVHFDSTLGVTNDTLLGWNKLGSGFTNDAILSDAGNQQNYYLFNTIQQDNPPYNTLVDINDHASTFERGYEEAVAPSISGGYYHRFTGQGMSVRMPYFKCEYFGVGSRLMFVGGYATGTCPSQSYSIDPNGSSFVLVGVDPAAVKAAARYNGSIVGGGGAVINDLKIGGGSQSMTSSNELIYGVKNCGTSTGCANNGSLSSRVVYGSVALSSGTPSAATITGLNPAYTSSSSYRCVVSNTTTQTNALKVANVSGSSFTITGPNSVTDTANYFCIGN